ncbi:MAG: DUF1934 domain-containing protein [Oscillospiraceae bacterium]|nr:DUF1934 domain-containing protein [Oscillospiraceae bacterium]
MLTIRSSQRSDNETDTTELNTTAQYLYRGGKAKIIYTELDEQGEPSGKTAITVLDERLVTIRKTGFTEAVMVLETGKTHPARYNTMLGAMEMRLCATEITSALHQDGGSLRLRYLLDIGESYSASNLIDLQVTLRTEG